MYIRCCVSQTSPQTTLCGIPSCVISEKLGLLHCEEYPKAARYSTVDIIQTQLPKLHYFTLLVRSSLLFHTLWGVDRWWDRVSLLQ